MYNVHCTYQGAVNLFYSSMVHTVQPLWPQRFDVQNVNTPGNLQEVTSFERDHKLLKFTSRHGRAGVCITLGPFQNRYGNFGLVFGFADSSGHGLSLLKWPEQVKTERILFHSSAIVPPLPCTDIAN